MFVNIVQYVDWIYRMTEIKEPAGVRTANDKELKVAYGTEIELEKELAKQPLDAENSKNKTITEKPSNETTLAQEGITVSVKVEETTKPAVQKDEAEKTTKADVQEDENQYDHETNLSDEYEEEKEDRRFQSERRIGGV